MLEASFDSTREPRLCATLIDLILMSRSDKRLGQYKIQRGSLQIEFTSKGVVEENYSCQQARDQHSQTDYSYSTHMH